MKGSVMISAMFPQQSRARILGIWNASIPLGIALGGFIAEHFGWRHAFVTTPLLTWLPTYYHRIEMLPMGKTAIKGGSIMLLALVGAPLGGFLADKWLKSRKNARSLFPALSSLVTSVALLAVFTILQGHVQYAILLLTGITAIAFVPAAVAVTQDVVHAGCAQTL